MNYEYGHIWYFLQAKQNLYFVPNVSWAWHMNHVCWINPNAWSLIFKGLELFKTQKVAQRKREKVQVAFKLQHTILFIMK